MANIDSIYRLDDISLHHQTLLHSSRNFATVDIRCEWRRRTSKESAVWTFVVTSDYDVAGQQFVNVIMFNGLKCCKWRCSFVGVLPSVQLPLLWVPKENRSSLLNIFHKVTSAVYTEIRCTEICWYLTRIVRVIWKYNSGPVFLETQCSFSSLIFFVPDKIKLAAILL